MKFAKPVPDDIDVWTHCLHGPDNNAVANDTVVGPPRHLQWVGPPRWTRDHNKLNSISSVVTQMRNADSSATDIFDSSEHLGRGRDLRFQLLAASNTQNKCFGLAG